MQLETVLITNVINKNIKYNVMIPKWIVKKPETKQARVKMNHLKDGDEDFEDKVAHFLQV